jgi:hypothetical protein
MQLRRPVCRKASQIRFYLPVWIPLLELPLTRKFPPYVAWGEDEFPLSDDWPLSVDAQAVIKSNAINAATMSFILLQSFFFGTVGDPHGRQAAGAARGKTSRKAMG